MLSEELAVTTSLNWKLPMSVSPGHEHAEGMFVRVSEDDQRLFVVIGPVEQHSGDGRRLAMVNHVRILSDRQPWQVSLF